jgi:hypothetical protein
MTKYESDRRTVRISGNNATAMPISPGKKPLYRKFSSVDELISLLELPAQLLTVGKTTELMGRYQPYAFERSRLEAWGFAEADRS